MKERKYPKEFTNFYDKSSEDERNLMAFLGYTRTKFFISQVYEVLKTIKEEGHHGDQEQHPDDPAD